MVVLSDDENSTAKLLEQFTENSHFTVEHVDSVSLIIRKLLAKTVDVIVAPLHAERTDSLALPYWIHELKESGQLDEPPYLIWVTRSAAEAAAKPSALDTHNMASSRYDIASIGLTSHVYLAHTLGMPVTLAPDETPLPLIPVLDAITRKVPEHFQTPERAESQESPSDEDVIRAMTTGENLRVVLQPQYDLQSHRIVGAEAMVRWHHPRLGEIPLTSLIPQVDRLGLDLLLFSYIETTVIEILGTLERARIDIPIAINASARTLCATGLATRLASKMEKAGVSNRRLKIELTEQLPPDSELLLSAAVMELRIKGFSISLDDFGAGCATLALLGHIHFDELKIDKSLIRGVGHSVQANKIISAIVNLAQLFNLNLVAEGIEESSSVELLNHLGCKTGQGYALAYPMEQADFLSLMKR